MSKEQTIVHERRPRVKIISDVNKTTESGLEQNRQNRENLYNGIFTHTYELP